MASRTHKRDKRGFAAPTDNKAAVDTQQAQTAVLPQTSSWQLLITSVKMLRLHLLPITALVLAPGLLTQLGTAMVGNTPLALATLQSPDPLKAAGYIVQALAGLWLVVSTPASLYLQLRAIGGFRASVLESYKAGFHFIIRLAGLCLMIGALVLGGLVLFIVPGVIAFRRYALSPYFLMDENLGIRQAMQRSAKASRPHRKHIWTLLGIILLVTAIAGLLSKYLAPFGGVIGVLLSASYLFATALRYQEISSNIRNGSQAFATPEA